MFSPGELLNETYRVVRRLGGGGFGDVFLADDVKIPDRRVAIKVLSKPNDEDHSDLLHEMRTLAKFQHANVVAFFHHFQVNTRLFLVMEFCPGGCLYDRIRDEGPQRVEQVFGWGLQLCETLAFVHDKEIVHRDIKPQNILFTADATIKLGDFGVANRESGTLIYLPPEVFLGGARATRLDPRVDVYALGLTLLQSITGRHPFIGLTHQEAVFARVEHDFVPDDLPRWVQEVLLKATHPDPVMRFQTAADFAEAIRDRHVPYTFDGNRIKADALAKRAETALARKNRKKADELSSEALDASPDCVSALLVAGRAQLQVRRLDRAKAFFTRALAVSLRTPVQKELGWIALEEGRHPQAISLLTDHLQRQASDYEAYNLLLKCFYLTDRFEVGEALAGTLLDEKAPNPCFGSNRVLCRLLNDSYDELEAKKLVAEKHADPFIEHAVAVTFENPSSWASDKSPRLKPKLLFEEYTFGASWRAGKKNTLSLYKADDTREDETSPIVTIGSLSTNSFVCKDWSVSRRHCAIVNFPGEVWLYDLGSSVGTFVDGERINGRVFLEGVHEVKIGRVRLHVASSSDRLL